MEEVKLSGKLPEEYVVKCKSAKELNEANQYYYKVDYDSLSKWKYLICSKSLMQKDGSPDGNTIENYIRENYNHFPVYTYKEWKELISTKDEFVLPDKWCVKINSRNSKVLGEYWNTQSGNICYTFFDSGYMHRYNNWGEDIIVGGKLGAYFHNFSLRTPFTEITYEQFIKYVLKQKEQVMETYRIKTKEEFVAEFGEKFHDKVYRSWNNNGDMDYLFGTEISKENYDVIIKDGSLGKVWPGKTSGITYWVISKGMITNKPLNNSISMKQNFAISGTTSLKEAFIKECGIKPYNSETVGYQYLTDMDGKQIQGITSDNCRKLFTLPKDWDAALAYVKDYYLPVITEKVVFFGKLKCTIKKGNNFATTEFGKITKSQISRVLDNFNKQIKILGYDLEIVGVDNLVLKFGCQQGTVAEAKALLKAFNE